MGRCECWRCARCGALSRHWRGYLRFAQVGRDWRPVCEDQLACRGRREAPPEGEVWLDIQDCCQGADDDEAGALAQAEPERANILCADGLVWCFDCKPVGIVASAPSGEACNGCGE